MQPVQPAFPFQGTWAILTGLASSLVLHGDLGKCRRHSFSFPEASLARQPCTGQL